jgi:hypothetical protein
MAGGSASALSLSRPAQASLALRPAGSLSRPEATFVTRLQPAQLPTRAARQLPDQSTTLWVESSSTSDPRLRGALPRRDIAHMSAISPTRSDCHCPQSRIGNDAPCRLDDFFARTALAARSLETIHFGPEYCGGALSPEESGEWGDGNERTGDEPSSRRERSETADGRRNPGHGKGSGSRREDSLQARGGNNRARINLALERVLFAALGKRELTSASPSYAAGEKTSSEVAFLRAWQA